MGQFKLKVAKKAKKDFEKIYIAGDKVSIARLEAIVEELSWHPKTGTGKPEPLKHHLSGFWSRSINKKDRLIYEVIEKPDKMVVIILALGHY